MGNLLSKLAFIAPTTTARILQTDASDTIKSDW